MSRKVKAHHLIRSFEHQEGLDPDRDDEVLKTEIDEEERKEDGNTHRLAALFDRVWVGDVRQRGASWSGRSRSGSESDQKVKRVVSVKRVVHRRGSESDSDSDEASRTKVTKVTRTTTLTKRDGRRGSESDSDREVVVVRKSKESPEKRRMKVVTKSALMADSDSSDDDTKKVEVKRVTKVQKRDSSDERSVKKVTVVKRTTKVEKRDSSDDREARVIKRTSKVVRRDSSSESESTTRKVTVVKAKKVERRDSSEERRARKTTKRVSRVVQRDSSDERVTKVVTKTTTVKVDKADSGDERRTKKAAKRVSMAKRDSSDERRETKQVTVVKKSATVVRHEESDSESEYETKRPAVVKKVTRKIVDASSDSEDDVQVKKAVNKKEVTVTKVTKVQRQERVSEDEKVVKKAVKAKKVVKKVESDSDDGRRVTKVVTIRKTKADSDSEDERVKKEVKMVKVTKVVTVEKSDSDSSDEEIVVVKKATVKQVKVERLPLKNKNILLVFAHVFKESYEGALVGAAVKSLKEQGADVQISNLFEMGFNPVASPQDFGGFVDDREFYSYSLVAGQAKAHGKLAQDIVAEQDKVDWADLVIIVSQLQSHGLPALLKGWFDRIMTYNFAFSDGHMYEKGRLRGKKALLCLTSEALSSMYTPRGIHGDLNVYLWPILNGLFRFAGFDVLKPQVYFGVGRASSDYREQVIDSFSRRVRGLFDETPLPFIGVDRFLEKRGYTLSDRSVNELEAAKRLTVGQYAGEPHCSMAIVLEPERRREAAEKVIKAKVRGSGVETKKPWHTLW